MKQLLHDRIITALSFFAGVGIAASALIGYAYIIPVSGSGYTVRQVCLFMVLLAVATGSLSGAFVSEYKRNDKVLLLSVLTSGMLLMLLPFYAGWIHNFTGGDLSLGGIIVYSFFILFLPVVSISHVIPLTVAGLKGGSAGIYARKTGIVFSVILLGIAVGSLTFSVWIIPAMGLLGTSLISGFLLAIIPAIQIFRQGWRKPGIFFILLALTLPAIMKGSGRISVLKNFDSSNLDENWVFSDGKILYNQNFFSLNDIKGKEEDATLIRLLENSFPGTAVLMVGCGNGNLIKTCLKNKLQLTLTDVYPQLLKHQATTFIENNDLTILEEHPRVFLNNTVRQFDIVLIDLLRGDNVPDGIFSAEALIKVRGMLNPGGLGVIRLPDIEDDVIDCYGTVSLYKTIRTLGLFTEISRSGPNEPSMVFFSGSRDAFDDKLDEIRNLTYYPPDSMHVDEVRLLTDNRSFLDLYYRREMDALWNKRHLTD